MDQPITIDLVIARSVRTLMAYHGLQAKDLPSRLEGLSRSTLYRRMEEGGWLASEVGAIAELFGVPVQDLYSGDIAPAASSLAGHSVRISREHKLAGQGPFSGSDMDDFLDALAAPREAVA